MLTSVIIPCWNALDLTRVCLRQLVRRTTLDYEVVVVDNGSVDGSGAWLKAFRAKALRENPHGTLRRFEIVSNAVNRGYPAAMNQGIREARGDLLLFGNSDAAVTPLWLEQMRAALKSRGSAIGGVSAFSNVPRAPGSAIRWESRPAYRGIKGLERYARAKLLQGLAPVYFPTEGFFPGFWFLTKASVIQEVGAFDERYGQGGFEDFDLQWRMRRAGYELGFAGRSYVHHVGFGCGEKNGLKNREFYGERKAMAFYDKFPGRVSSRDLGESRVLASRKPGSTRARRLRLDPSPEPVSDRVRLLKESKVFCMAPWTHLSVQPSGAVLPCCLGTTGPQLGSLRTQSLEIVWNSAVMRGLRRNMLSGKESPQCGICYDQEALGLQSLRRDLNWSSLSQFPVVETTREDGFVGKLNLPWLEIRFSNICNFKCRNCGPHYSSAWHADAAAMDMPVPEQPLMRPDADPERLWRQVEELLPGLEQFSFVGGEPLLMEEHWRLLNLLIERKMFHVGLNYTTNFSIMSHAGQDAMKLWKKFRFVSVTASLDGMGARGEYLRHGQDWGLVLENRKRLLETCPKARFSLLATVSAMNALHLPDFHREWIEKGLIQPDAFMLNILREPKEYSVQILPAAIKDKIEARYREHVERFLPSTGLPHRGSAASFGAVVAHLRAEDKSWLLDRFSRTTLTLDRLREENFAEVFPELAELVKTP